jgi:hypothetical protein
MAVRKGAECVWDKGRRRAGGPSDSTFRPKMLSCDKTRRYRNRDVAMKRRSFVQAGMSALLLPGAVMIPASVGVARLSALDEDHFFFDERFAEARRLARELRGRATPIPVQGDVTPVWIGGLDRASLSAPMTLGGVTTESFHFCLKILLGDHARVDTQVRRVDRDLHLWTMRTDNQFNSGTVSWQNHSRRA